MESLLLTCLFLATSAVEDRFSLLQWSLPQPEDLLSPASQEARLQAALPLAWIHIPKCGSSFANFLVDLPGVCPGIPPNAQIANASESKTRQLQRFDRRWHVKGSDSDGACQDNIFRWGNHRGIPGPATWGLHYRHHAMIMMRDPEQRLLSAYHAHTHSWPWPEEPANVLEFAKQVQGCAVRQLTRNGKRPEEVCGGGSGGLPTTSEVDLAIKRLRSDFAFVGLTDQWALSMCLGHRMFGGACHQSDFVDTRVTYGRHEDVEVRAATVPWNISSLQGFRDLYDGPLYKVGVEVFSDELSRYRTSLESCKSCFQEAGVNVKS